MQRHPIPDVVTLALDVGAKVGAAKLGFKSAHEHPRIRLPIQRKYCSILSDAALPVKRTDRKAQSCTPRRGDQKSVALPNAQPLKLNHRQLQCSRRWGARRSCAPLQLHNRAHAAAAIGMIL